MTNKMPPAFLAPVIDAGSRDGWNSWPVNVAEYGAQPTANVREFSRVEYAAYDTARRAQSHSTFAYFTRTVLSAK